MSEMFFRQNKHSVFEFMKLIPNSILKNYYLIKKLEDDYCYRKNIYLADLNKSLNKSDSINTRKELLKIRKKIRGNRYINIDKKYANLEQYNNDLSNYSHVKKSLLEGLSLKNKEDFYNLLKYFDEKDFALSNNKKISYILENKTDKIKKRDVISLYNFANQLSLKTGAFGLTGKVGLIDENGLVSPDKRIIVKLNGTLSNRVYRKYLFRNVSNYTGEFELNRNFYKDGNNNLVFQALVDDEKASVFCNIEKTIKIKNNKKIQKLLSQGSFDYNFISKLYTDESINKLISLGLLNYPFNDYINNLFLIIDTFKDVDSKVLRYIQTIKSNMKLLEENFSCDVFVSTCNLISVLINKILSLDLGIKQPITIDSYLGNENIKDKKIVVENYNYIQSHQKELDYLAYFFSYFDPSKRTFPIVKSFFQKNNIKNVSFRSSNMHLFLDQLTKYVLSKLDIGGIRTGINLLNKKLLHKISSSGSDKFIISQKDFDLLDDLEIAKACSYSMFLQKGDKNIVLNHIYKGYGVFNRRFRQNYKDQNFNDKYGINQLLDFGYNFGFNADNRKIQNVFDLGYNYTEHCNKINSVFFQDSQMCLKGTRIELNHKGETITPTFLGSLTPMAYPSTISMMNFLFANGSLYFDLGDLILRYKYIYFKKDNIICSPNIYFLSQKIMISRKKILVKGETIRILYNSSSNIFEFVQKFKDEILKNHQFFIKQFFMELDDFDQNNNKPLYINIYNPISIEALLNYCDKTKWVVLEELNPSFNKDDNLTEYIYENKKHYGYGETK